MAQEINNEFDDYLKNENSYSFIVDEINELKLNGSKNIIPIFVLSYKYDKKRSKFIVQLMNELDKYENINRQIFIFVYSDEKEHYSFLDKYSKNIQMIYIDKNEVNSTLSGKRNYMIDYAHQHKFENIFMIEDDCSNFFIPIPKFKEDKFAKNQKYFLTIEKFFDLWEHIVLKNNHIMTSPLIEFAVVIQLHTKLFTTNTTCIQMFQFNINYLKEKNIAFDHNSGWDDFDMCIQVFNSGADTHTFYPMGYGTISVKSGNSVIDNNIFERFKKNSYIFLNKWGSEYVKIVEKRGLINARINWIKIKKNRNKKSIDLNDLF